MNTRQHVKRTLQDMDTFLKELELSGCEVTRYPGVKESHKRFLAIKSSKGSHGSVWVYTTDTRLLHVIYQPRLFRARKHRKFFYVQDMMDWIADFVREHGEI